jgi:hypothetical protein
VFFTAKNMTASVEGNEGAGQNWLARVSHEFPRL